MLTFRYSDIIWSVDEGTYAHASLRVEDLALRFQAYADGRYSVTLDEDAIGESTTIGDYEHDLEGAIEAAEGCATILVDTVRARRVAEAKPPVAWTSYPGGLHAEASGRVLWVGYVGNSRWAWELIETTDGAPLVIGNGREASRDEAKAACERAAVKASAPVAV